MTQEIGTIDVIVPLAPVVSVTSVGVQGPPGVPGADGEPGPPGPQGEPGPPGAGAGPHQASHAAGGTDQIVGPLALGVNPAQSGSLRLANGQSNGIRARTADNANDAQMLFLDAGNNLQVGDSSFGAIGLRGDVYLNGRPVIGAGAVDATSVSVGVNPAQSGAVRLANNEEIKARNAANTGDVRVFQIDAADNAIMGSYSDATLHLDSKNHIAIRAVGGTATYTIDGAGIYPGSATARVIGHASLPFEAANIRTSVNIGTNPAQSGAVRLANNQSITARNPYNDGDYRLLATDSGGNVFVGAQAGGPVYVDSGYEVNLRAGGALVNVSSTLNSNVPIVATGFRVGAVAGVDGSFTTADGKTVTVTKGIITGIV